MKQFSTYKEYRNSSKNVASENSLYIRIGSAEQIHRVHGQDWTRRKMIALIASLELNDFLIDVNKEKEAKILKLFAKAGYVPAGYFDEGKCMDFLFVKQ